MSLLLMFCTALHALGKHGGVQRCPAFCIENPRVAEEFESVQTNDCVESSRRMPIARYLPTSSPEGPLMKMLFHFRAFFGSVISKCLGDSAVVTLHVIGIGNGGIRGPAASCTMDRFEDAQSWMLIHKVSIGWYAKEHRFRLSAKLSNVFTF